MIKDYIPDRSSSAVPIPVASVVLRAMRPHHAVRTARATVPAALVTPRVAGALTPADDARMAYPAALGLKRDAFPIHRAVCHPYPQAKTPCCLCPSRGGLGEDRALDC